MLLPIPFQSFIFCLLDCGFTYCMYLLIQFKELVFIEVSDLLPTSPGVVNDLVQSPKKAFRGDRINIQHHSDFSAHQPLGVVGLVPTKWHHHHGNSMTQSLKEPVRASVSDEGPGSRMC